jgi:8-oxo-dGTP diphosphatase
VPEPFPGFLLAGAMMGAMKRVKRSVAVVVRRPASPAGGGLPAGEFLVVRRPDDPDDPLAGVWGLPAVTLLDGEDEEAAVVRAGRVKLGVELAVGARIGEKTADRGGYILRLADYEAAVVAGVPAVPQPDGSMTQYTECRYAADPEALAEAASRGSLCAQVFLEDRARGEGQGGPATTSS